MRVDNTVPYDVFNSNVEYNLADVDYTKGICLSDEETTNMKDHIVEVGPGAAAFLVHGLSKTNMKEGMIIISLLVKFNLFCLFRLFMCTLTMLLSSCLTAPLTCQCCCWMFLKLFSDWAYLDN